MLATLTLRETDCYSWHDSKVRHTLADAAPSRAKPFTLGISVSRNESASQLTADRSVRRRVFPWGRRSPLRSKELWNYPAALHTAAALSKLHKCVASVCARRPRWLCARPPSWDGVDRY